MLNRITPPADRLSDLVMLMDKNVIDNTRADRDRNERLLRALAERRSSIEAEASWLPCRNASGAMLKLVALESRLSTLLEDQEGYDFEVAAYELSRVVGSLLRWIEDAFDTRREDYGLDYYHTDKCEAAAWGLRHEDGEKVPS